LDTRSVGSVWFRRQGAPLLADGLAPGERSFVESECLSFLTNFYDTLHCRWVNPRLPEARAASKLYQQQVAQEVGLATPRTLVTNCPHTAREFANKSPGRVLFKPNGGPPQLNEPNSAAQTPTAYAQT